MGGRRPRAQQPQQQGEMNLRQMLTQLAPLLILFLFTFLSAVPSLFSEPQTPDPRYAFNPSSRFNLGRQTNALNVNYYVNKAEFSSHPIGEEISRVQAAKGAGGEKANLLEKFERSIEQHYKEQVYHACQREQELQQRRREQKMGFLGLGRDVEALKAIDAERLEYCEELKRLYNHH